MKKAIPTSRVLRKAISLDVFYHHYNDIVYLAVNVICKDGSYDRFSSASCDSEFRLLEKIAFSFESPINVKHFVHKENFYPKEKLTFNK